MFKSGGGTLNMGPIFLKIFLNMSLFFQNVLVLAMWKSPKKWAPLCAKMTLSPLAMGMGFKARVAHPHPIQIWVPQALNWQARNFSLLMNEGAM